MKGNELYALGSHRLFVALLDRVTSSVGKSAVAESYGLLSRVGLALAWRSLKDEIRGSRQNFLPACVGYDRETQPGCRLQEIPERHITMTFSLRCNSDPALPGRGAWPMQ
jgi:hypothetical protein